MLRARKSVFIGKTTLGPPPGNPDSLPKSLLPFYTRPNYQLKCSDGKRLRGGCKSDNLGVDYDIIQSFEAADKQFPDF